MISRGDFLTNIFCNLIGWQPVNHISLLNYHKISKKRTCLLFNNLRQNHPPLSTTNLKAYYAIKDEIRKDYLKLENYHQDKFTHKKIDTIMIGLLLSLIPCLIITCMMEFGYFFFYLGAIGLLQYLYGYKFWNKIRSANLLKDTILRLEEVEEEISPLNSILTCISLLADKKLIEINNTQIASMKYEEDFNIRLNQTQFAFLLTRIVECEKIRFGNRKQTEIAQSIAKNFTFLDADINSHSLKNDINKFYTMKDKKDLQNAWDRYLPNLYKLFDNLAITASENQSNINN